MAHFNQLEPRRRRAAPPNTRPRPDAQSPAEPARKLTLRGLVVRLVRGGEARTAELGEGLRRTEVGRWGSGRLLAALEEWLGRRSVVGRTGGAEPGGGEQPAEAGPPAAQTV